MGSTTLPQKKQKKVLLYCLAMLLTQQPWSHTPGGPVSSASSPEAPGLIHQIAGCNSSTPLACSIAPFAVLVAGQARPPPISFRLDARRSRDPDCTFTDHRSSGRLRRTTASRRPSRRRLCVNPPGRGRAGAGAAGLAREGGAEIRTKRAQVAALSSRSDSTVEAVADPQNSKVK